MMEVWSNNELPTKQTNRQVHKRNTQMALVSLAKLLHKYYKHTHRLDPEKVRAEQEAETDSEEEEEDSHKEKDKEETEEEETENDSANDDANNLSLPILCCHNCGESFAGRDYVIRVPGAFRAHKIWDSTAELCQNLRGVTPVRHRDMLEAIRNREQSDIDVRVHASMAKTTTTHCENENGSASGNSSDDNGNEEDHSVDNNIATGDDSEAAVGDGWKSCFSSPKYIHLHCWQYWYFRPCGTMFERKGLNFRDICRLHSKINEWQKLYNQRIKNHKRFEEQEQKKKQRLEAKQQKEREKELKRSEKLRLREQKKAEKAEKAKAKSSSSSGSGTTTRRRTTRSAPAKVTSPSSASSSTSTAPDLSADNELQPREEGEEQHVLDHPDEDEESKSKRIKLDDTVTNNEVSLQNYTAPDTENDDPYLLNISSDIWVQIISFLRVPFLVHSLSLASKGMHYYVNLEYTWSVLATVNLSREFNSVRMEYYGHMSAREAYRASHKHFCESCGDYCHQKELHYFYPLDCTICVDKCQKLPRYDLVNKSQAQKIFPQVTNESRIIRKNNPFHPSTPMYLYVACELQFLRDITREYSLRLELSKRMLDPNSNVAELAGSSNKQEAARLAERWIDEERSKRRGILYDFIYGSKELLVRDTVENYLQSKFPPVATE